MDAYKYGEASRKRNIRSGIEYDHLFSKAPGEVYTVKQNATLEDTMAFIPKIIPKICYQTELIANDRKGSSVYESCYNVWHWVYGHIQYKKDKKGYEQVRSPRRSWHDRATGVDCDCYSVLISCILTNLKIPHVLRITKYREKHFQHIYPIVPLGSGYITMDCVTDRFNYEVPFSVKKDYNMDLQFLDGIPDNNLTGKDDGMAELGKIIKRNMAARNKGGAAAITSSGGTSPIARKSGGGRSAKRAALVQRVKSQAAAIQAGAGNNAPAQPSSGKKKKKGILKKVSLKKVLNVVNKINPATVLLRNGLLAAMKLNILKVAGRLRWGYLNQEQAANIGIDIGKWQRLQKVLEKLNKIFYGAGGKPDNLKKAILKGKGNKDHKVPLNGFNGLGALEIEGLNSLNLYSPMQELLGRDIYYSENVEGLDGVDLMEGFGELGEPVTMASVTAAMGALTAIAASLKSIGSIFKGGKGGEDFDEKSIEEGESNIPAKDAAPASAGGSSAPPENPTQPGPDEAPPAAGNRMAARISQKQPGVDNEDGSGSSDESVPDNSASADTDNTQPDESDKTPSNSLPVKAASAALVPSDSNSGNKSADKKTDNNNKWIKPVAIGVGVLAVGVIGYHLFKGNKPKNKSSPHQSLSGAPKSGKKNHQRKTKKNKKVAVKLM